MAQHAHKLSVMVFVLLLTCGLFSVPTLAQITITNTDIQTAYAVGNQFSFFSDTSATPVFVGTASGTAQTWDFRALPFLYQGRGASVLPAGAPQINQFPTANIVTYSVTHLSSGDSIDGYTYHQLTPSTLLFLGVGGTDTSVIRYSPPLPAMRLPCTYATTWNHQSDTNHIIPGLMWVMSIANYTMDAFGTLRLPVGDYPALRMKNVTFTYSYNLFTGLSRSKSITYSFMTRGLTGTVLSIDSTQENLSTVVPDYVVYTRSGTSDVKELVGGQIPSEFSLEQNYPNPFNPTTTINFQLPTINHVTLKVFDILGREIATLVNEDLPAGKYEMRFDAANLAGGVYFYRLQSAGHSLARAMLLIK